MDNKFQFGTDFQLDILKLTVTDIKLGPKVISFYEDHSFTLIEHAVIASGIKYFYKKHKRIPGKTALKEVLRTIYKTKDYRDTLLDDDKKRISRIVTKIYTGVVKDSDIVYEASKKFNQYLALIAELETIDPSNFDQYESFASRIQKAINKGNDLDDDRGLFLIADAKLRINKRKNHSPSFPTPFWQLNNLLNDRGTNKGNIIALLAPAKRFKTGFLLNLAKGYARLRRRVLIADFENGEDSLSIRADQTILGKDRDEIISGKHDQALFKVFRKYKRFGAEIVIKRFPAYSTSLQIGSYMKGLRDDYGLVITDLIVDYADLMGDSKGSQDDTQRISNAYIDLKNLGNEYELNSIWTPSHVTREGDKNQLKKYKANDIAKSIDKIRHADMILGLNQDDVEIDSGILRLEVVEQRNGPQVGTAFFHINMAKQLMKEFSRREALEYREARKTELDDKDYSKSKKPKDLSDE